MTLIRMTVKLTRTAGVPEDTAINVWHYESVSTIPDGNTDTYADMSTQAEIFYGTNLNVWLNNSVSRAALAHVIEFRTIIPGAGGPGDDGVSPLLFSHLFGFPAANPIDAGLPSEMAACLSFTAEGAAAVMEEDEFGNRPRARRRGRVYIGPLSTAVLVQHATTKVVTIGMAVADTLIADYNNQMNGQMFLTAGVNHVVYSPTAGTTHPVQLVWMDNAFDVIRSRGEKANQRVTQLTGP